MTWLCQIDWTAVPTIALAIVTASYVWSTRKILKESQKNRQAVERQATAVKESNRLLIQKSKQASRIGITIIASAIQTAKRNIDQWKSYDLYFMAANRYFSENIDLDPPKALSAIEHARIISTEGYFQLSSPFDNLRQASLELNISGRWDHSNTTFLHDHLKAALHFINMASSELDAAMTYLHEAVIPGKKP